MALEKCSEHNIGWYLFELMMHGYWGDVHGVVYPDGTVRDPSIVAAIHGFYRKRDKQTSITPDPNKEGYAYRAVKMMEEALKQKTAVFKNKKSSTNYILEAANTVPTFLKDAKYSPCMSLRL